MKCKLLIGALTLLMVNLTALAADDGTSHTKGEPSSNAPHNKGIAGLSDEHARAIAEYIKTMKEVAEVSRSGPNPSLQ